MRLGFGILRLCPRDFWSMTPLELRAAAHGLSGGAMKTLDRAGLGGLMKIFPDTPRRNA